MLSFQKFSRNFICVHFLLFAEFEAILTVKPTVTSTKTTVQGEIGKSIKLQATVTNLRNGDVTWTRCSVSNSDQSRIKEEGTNLVINSIQWLDQSKYTLTAVNKFGKSSVSIDLKVTGTCTQHNVFDIVSATPVQMIFMTPPSHTNQTEIPNAPLSTCKNDTKENIYTLCVNEIYGIMFIVAIGIGWLLAVLSVALNVHLLIKSRKMKKIKSQDARYGGLQRQIDSPDFYCSIDSDKQNNMYSEVTT